MSITIHIQFVIPRIDQHHYACIDSQSDPETAKPREHTSGADIGEPGDAENSVRTCLDEGIVMPEVVELDEIEAALERHG